MACINKGPLTYSLSRDEDGYRTYKIKFLVEGTILDGPANALRAAGLPIPGSYWSFFGDIDFWATCRWDADVKMHKEEEGQHSRFWTVEQTFTNKPPKKWCKEHEIEDPLLEPFKMQVQMAEKTEEAYMDRFGLPVVNSAHEQLRGAAVEFDKSFPCVSIWQNIASFTQAVTIPEGMLHHLNDSPLWGYPAGTVKLSVATAEKKWYGQCYSYWERNLRFDLNGAGWARDILDEGTKVLKGKWGPAGNYVLETIGGQPPDPNNPSHFERFTDRKGNPARVILNGRGVPAEVMVGSGGYFVSIADGNINHSVKDRNYWVPQTVLAGAKVTNLLEPEEFDPDTVYAKGEFVKVTDDQGVPAFYVCISEFSYDAVPSITPLEWRGMGFGTLIDPFMVLANKGAWNAAVTYRKKDRVLDLGGTTAGIIHIERYPFANFYLLGIPTILSS